MDCHRIARLACVTFWRSGDVESDSEQDRDEHDIVCVHTLGREGRHVFKEWYKRGGIRDKEERVCS